MLFLQGLHHGLEILLVDEGQELLPSVLTVVLAGDGRLTEKLRHDDLRPLDSRIRLRLTMDTVTGEELNVCLNHLLEKAGNTTLMTAALKSAICDHALGNYRANLLTVAVERDLPQLDEKLYFEVFAPEGRKLRRAGVRP
jgi:general secretion pathway protein A